MTIDVNKINDEIYGRIPDKDETQHLYACSINHILAGQYMEGYEKYKTYCMKQKETDCKEKYKIITYIANRMLKQKEYKKVATLLWEVKDEFKGDLFIYNNLAVALVKTGEINSAVEVLKVAIALHPEHQELQRNYAKLEHFLNA